MNDVFVTFQGWVGGDVTHRETKDGNVVNFRVGSTPRIRKRSGEWVDGETTWFSVSAWRSLADNIRDSVRKGDAVVVHGRLRTDVWTREDGQTSTTFVVEATVVGHDLTRGQSTFMKSTRPVRDEADAEVESELKELLHSEPGDLPRLDSFGNPLAGEHSAA
ncbi:MAG TPA: single-stranded DNA-binding protein [Nocardioidaceae bacterium]|jgi:single-strand DNA-binding protein|nr:single-stranded DNA-binding protein [Nocardioidaceae bacterium]